MSKSSRIVLVSVALVLAASSVFALFTNGDFETGDFTGWTKSTYLNPGLSGAPPFTASSIVRNAGGVDWSTVEGGPAVTPLSLTDGLAGSGVAYPRFNHYAARVNYPGGNYPNRNANTILQQTTIALGDVDSYDGLPHVRFAYLPVVQNGGHVAAQQAHFFLVIRNVSKGNAIIWQRFAYANEPGVPWLSSGSYQYTNWQVVDVAPGSGQMDVGDTIELEVLAAGCSQGGHSAWVYLDAFGSEIPGMTITASAPASVNAGGSLTYDFHLKNSGSGTLTNAQASITIPAQTTFVSVSNPSCTHSAGVVTCALGDVPAGTIIDFEMSVAVSPTASGTITLGNYSVSGTNYPALLGPLVTTTVVNTVPTAGADGYGVTEDIPLVVAASGILSNDSDPEGNPITAVLVTGPSHGVLSSITNGGFTYTPAANYFGPDSFTYRASDGVNQSAPATVTLTVTGTPDPPTTTADGYSVAEDATLTVPAAGVLANDSDPDGDPITAIVETGPSHGVLTLNANGSFVYTPTANYHGPDSFTYRATDGTLQSGVTTVSLTVTSVADTPTAAGDSYGVTEDVALTIAAPGVLANDSDGDSDPLTALLVTGPSHGVLTLNANGSFVYTPAANYAGPDSFTYRASDGGSQSAPATVSLTIAAVPDAPTATADGYSVDEDGTLTVPAAGVLANDMDGDGDAITAILVTGPAHGTLTLNADGSFVYTPAANYHGPDSFTYRATDGTLQSGITTVSLTVTSVPDTPTATNDSYSGSEDVTLVIAAPGVLGNDSDGDGDPLTAVLVTAPAHGTLTLNANGSFTYVPDADYNGSDGFTYRASDGTNQSAQAIVTLTIAAVDDTAWSPHAGRAPGGVRVTIRGVGYGPAGTPVTLTIGGVPGLKAEVLDDNTITFVTPALPPNVLVDIVFTVGGGSPQTLSNAYLPLPVPAPGDPADTDGDGITDEIELKYGLDPTDPGDADDDPDGDGIDSLTETRAGRHPNAPYIRYFAEGLTNASVGTFIAIANSSPATMEAQVTFFRQNAAPARHNVTLAGLTRTLVNVGSLAGLANAAFGVSVEGNEAVAADRTMSWNLGGEGGHSEHAVEASTTWYFAEGATTGRFTLFYLLTNPGDQAATVAVRFLRQVGAPIDRTFIVPAFARVTVPVNTTDPGLASADLGGVVTSDRPIVAERSMYLSTASRTWVAGTSGTGVPQPALRWFFGEGATGDFFDAWILLSNPGTADATVTVRYVADNGADVTRTHMVPAGRRITIRVVDEDPSLRNTSFGTTVTSTNSVPVVAERAMWWRSTGSGWTGGHVGVGFTAGGRAWVTADGTAAIDGSTDTFALVSNTENRAGTITVTALFGDGTAPVQKSFSLTPNQRFTVRARKEFPEVVGKSFSFLIESVGASPVDIVVDHSTYWTVGGEFWGAGTTAPGSRVR